MRCLPRLPWPPRPVVAVAMTMAIGACSSAGPVTSSRTATSAAGEPSTTTVAPPTAIAGTSITIQGFAFQPLDLRAKVGDTITVTNGDGTDHSLTAVDGSFDTGRFATGTKTFTVARPGRFEFKCEVHSFMPHGSIQVSG